MQIENNFKMIDVGNKRPTKRLAVAKGKIYMNEEAFNAILHNTIPKGNIIALAEAAGIMGAKNTPNMLIMCHPLGLDQALVNCTLNKDENSVTAYCQVLAHAKTGVEMEALAGVNAALLTIWDLTKAIDPNLKISDVSLLLKIGGKSGVWKGKEELPSFLQGLVPDYSFKNKKVAVCTISDRASSNEYEDLSGNVLKKLIEENKGQVASYSLIPDELETIKQEVLKICSDESINLLITTGGTGPGAKDLTPKALDEIAKRNLSGFGEFLRQESLYFTPTAWLSRSNAYIVNKTLVLSFPGSPKACKECFDIIHTFIEDALNKIAKQGL